MLKGNSIVFVHENFVEKSTSLVFLVFCQHQIRILNQMWLLSCFQLRNLNVQFFGDSGPAFTAKKKQKILRVTCIHSHGVCSFCNSKTYRNLDFWFTNYKSHGRWSLEMFISVEMTLKSHESIASEIFRFSSGK